MFPFKLIFCSTSGPIYTPSTVLVVARVCLAELERIRKELFQGDNLDKRVMSTRNVLVGKIRVSLTFTF